MFAVAIVAGSRAIVSVGKGNPMEAALIDLGFVMARPAVDRLEVLAMGQFGDVAVAHRAVGPAMNGGVIDGRIDI